MLITRTEKSARVYCHIKVVKCCKIQKPRRIRDGIAAVLVSGYGRELAETGNLHNFFHHVMQKPGLLRVRSLVVYFLAFTAACDQAAVF